MRILILEAGATLGDQTIVALRSAGLYHDHFNSLAEGTEALLRGDFSALVLRDRLPDGDGIAWFKARRSHTKSLPAIIVIASPRPEDRAAALDAGFDDCLSSPLHPRELAARLRAVLRRPKELAASVIEAGNLRLDCASRELWADGSRVSIPRRELSLIEVLMRRFNRVVPRAAIESMLYGQNEVVCPNSLEVRVSRVRRHLAYAKANVTIQTVRGTGYMLHSEAAGNRPAGLPSAELPPGVQFLEPLRMTGSHF